MAKVIHADEHYKILKTSRDYILKNKKGDYSCHGHFKKLNTCYLMIKLIDKKVVPDSDYLRGSALRISTDNKYKDKVLHKIDKDKQKRYYINVNKGIKR